uniref:Major facilitator superfamily (MFS) profile domain-containing protein n=2 Tax=Panagrolaimus TaxID=55784 RepID=A0A914Q9Q0_9BILA
MVSQPLAGLFCTSNLGWQSIYYLQGGITIVAFIIFFLIYSDNPRDHKYVTETEASYIEGYEPSIVVDESLPRVSYKGIFTDKSMIGTFIVAIGNFFCFNIFMLFAPIYLNKVLELNIQQTGIISALPYLGNIILRLIIGPVSDKLTALTPQNSVRLFMGLSQVRLFTNEKKTFNWAFNCVRI